MNGGMPITDFLTSVLIPVSSRITELSIKLAPLTLHVSSHSRCAHLCGLRVYVGEWRCMWWYGMSGEVVF